MEGENQYIRLPRSSLLFLVWHFALLLIVTFNWIVFISAEESMLGVGLVRLHLSFNIIGYIFFIFVSSPFIFWPYRYGAYMFPNNRRNKIFSGIVIIYIFHVLPCVIVETIIVCTYGWFTVIQGASFILLIMTFILETLGAWFAYAWHLSSFFHSQYGDTELNQGTPKDKYAQKYI